MPNSFKLNSIGQRVTLGAAIAALAIAFCGKAQADNGNFRTGTCGTASAIYVTLTNGQSTYGFGGTSAAAQLSQSGSGTAGLLLNPNYTVADPTSANDFRLISISSNDGENKGAKKTVTLKYCFQSNHGTGKTVEYTTTLNKLSSTGIGNGFKTSSQNSREFGGLNVKDMVLRRLSITVEDASPSNITIGDVSITTASGEFSPVGINLNPAGCNTLYTCPQQVQVQ